MSAHENSRSEMLPGKLAASKQELDDLASIQAGIADMEAGRFRPFAEIDAEFRAKHGIPKPGIKQARK